MQAQPEDRWSATVYAGADDFDPIGAAVVVADRFAITCAHVVSHAGAVRAGLWLAFPKSAGWRQRRQVRLVTLGSHVAVADVALLELAEPVPAGVAAAPVRFPAPGDLVGRRWWAFGFLRRDPLGSAAEGTIGAELGYGWVRLDTASRYRVEPGFSGGGLYSPDYRAVVGLVGQANAAGANHGDGRAITLHEAHLCLPEPGLRVFGAWSAPNAGGPALAAWGWTLHGDPEAGRHWRPRARGVAADSERGHRFRGRTAALRAITGWLERPAPDRRLLVVTGSPGVGKSAVLGRVVTTADPDLRAALPDGDTALRASAGSIACAVHAKGKTALDVATEIARAASAALPAEPADLAPALRRALAGAGQSPAARFNVALDALDEAADPAEVRSIVADVVLPLVRTCADLGAQVVVGTRRRDRLGDVLRLFGAGAVVVDLDAGEYFSAGDLTAYALATLRLDGDERAGNPYTDDGVALPVAERIAALSGRNFLVAGLVARTHGLHDEVPAEPSALGFTADVDGALRGYVERLRPVDGLPAGELLAALSFAEPPGWTPALWVAAARALGEPVDEAALHRFARSAGANFLVESGDGTYRLFHQALEEALRRDRAAADDAAVGRALLAHGRGSGWADAPQYLLRSLPQHAAAGGFVDDLLVDDEYVLHADLRRLLAVADRATSPAAVARARLLRLSPFAVDEPPRLRAALFNVTAATEGLGPAPAAPAWFTAKWAATRRRVEHSVVEVHDSEVNAVCVLSAGHEPVLASAADDGTVQVWDATTGTSRATLSCPASLYSVCAVPTPDGVVVAAAGDDGVIRLWDPAGGEPLLSIESHTGHVYALCAVAVGDDVLLASAGDDDLVRLWSPVDGGPRGTCAGHTSWVHGLCTVVVDGASLLVSAGRDGRVLVWNPVDGTLVHALDGHAGAVFSVAAVTVDGRGVLASAGDDSTVRLWDAVTGEARAVLQGRRGGANAVAAFTVDGVPALAVAGGDGRVTLWQADTLTRRRTLRGHAGPVYGVCGLELDGRALVVSVGADATARLWDPAAPAAPTGDGAPVRRLCVDGATVFACGGPHTIRAHDLETGALRWTRTLPTSWTCGIGMVELGGRRLVAVIRGDGTVHTFAPDSGEPVAVQPVGDGGAWYEAVVYTHDGRPRVMMRHQYGTLRTVDLATGTAVRPPGTDTDRVTRIAAWTGPDRTLLAIADESCAVTVSDATSGTVCTIDVSDIWWPSAMTFIRVRDRLLLATAGRWAVQLWDAATGVQVAELLGHRSEVHGVCGVSSGDRWLLATVSADRTVGIWDLRTAGPLMCVPVHHAAEVVAADGRVLVVGTAAGVLAIELDRELPR